MKAPDGSDLTPEEWDAVRRLRGEREAHAEAEPVEPDPVEPDLVEPDPVEPDPVEVRAVEVQPPAEPVDTSPDRGSPPLLLPAMVSLVLLAVVAVALLSVVTARLSDRHGQRSDATAALTAATDGVATVLSYNYKSLDADFAKAESLLTPAFRKSYDATTAKGVQPLAAKYHAVSTAQVTAAGVMSQSGSHVQVVVFVSQQVTNTQLSAPRLDRSRIIVDLQKSGSRWLINNLNPV